MLIRVYTAFLTASQALFDRFGQAADPYLTAVGYFNSLRELGGMIASRPRPSMRMVSIACS